jgi:hypothetical protein
VVAVVVAFVVGVITTQTDPAFVILAPLFGVGIGAFLAGKRAKVAPLYHGALVAAGYVLLEGNGIVPTPLGVGDNALADSVAVILTDAVLLAVGALSGLLAARRVPSSSSGTDKDR